MDKPIEDKKEKIAEQKFHIHSKKAFVVCPACLQNIYGISEAQAKAMLKEHQRSKICKQIALALKQDRNARKDSKPASVEPKNAETA